MNKTGLGRGLSAFLSEEDTEEKISDVTQISVLDIDPNLNQPRKAFDEAALGELAESIKNVGVVQPIVLVKKENRYQIVAGERRWRASILAGLKHIPAVVRDYDERQIKEISLIENLQRADLNDIEKAEAMQVLIDEYALTQNDLAQQLGISRPNVANTLRLLSMPEQIKNMVVKSLLSAGHARALAALTDTDTMIRIAEEIIKKGYSVRETERLIRALNNKKPAKNPIVIPEIKEFEDQLCRSFKTKVRVDGTYSKGKIIISYFSKDELEALYERLSEK